jgi:glycine/D-amino acid oxidase-like deaminating enzyme
MPVTNRPIWDTADALQLPELAATADADVCVVGLGGSGLTCIRELIDRGKRVVGVDAVSIASGAAGGNGGFLLGGLAMFHHDAVARLGAPIATAIYEQTLKQIDRIAAETPSAVRRTGTLRLAASADELEDCRLQYEAMRHNALPVDWYNGPEGRGLLFPADAAFDPGARCQALASEALSRGAQLFGRSPVVSVDTGQVVTPNGVVRADQVVIAVDGKLEVVLPELSARVRSARLQMLGTAPDPNVDVQRPIYSRRGLDYWQQLRDGRIVIGGARDVGGDAEWTTETGTTPSVQAALETLLRDQVGSQSAVTHRWAATVAYTQSGLPILEEVRTGVWAIGGYSGTGNVIGALCGRAVAETIVRGRSELAALLRA